MLVEQLGICLRELKTLKTASSMDETRSTLSKLLATQEHERKEMEEQMAEEAHHLHNFQADYQRLVDDSRESEIITNNAEQVIATARAIIAKVQAFIQVNEQKLAVARKKLKELEATKKLVQENFAAHSSRLESLQTQLSTKRFLSEEELRVQVWRKPRRHASRRCSASGNGSILWRSRIISLLPLFVFPYFSITLHLSKKGVFCVTFIIFESNNKVIKFLSCLYPFFRQTLCCLDELSFHSRNP